MAKNDTAKHSWLLQPRLWVIAIILLCAVVSGIAFLIIRDQYLELEARTLESNKAVVRLLGDLVLQHQKAATALLQAYASRPLLIDAVKRKDVAAVHWHMASLKRASDEIDLTFVTDPSGRLWANFPVFPEAIGKTLSDRDWYKGVSAQWKPYVSAVFRLIVSDKPLATAVAIPVTDRNDVVVGILASSMRLTVLSDTISRVPLRPYVKLTLIDQQGTIVHSTGFSYKTELTAYPFLPAVKDVLGAGKDHAEIADPWGGGARFLTVQPVAAIGWTVIVEHTRRGIIRAGLGQTVPTAIIALFSIVLMSVFLFIARRHLVYAEVQRALIHERELREEEERFRQLFENMNSAVAIYGARSDGEDFVFRDLNGAGERIERVSREQIVGRSVLEVFPGIKEMGLFEVLQRVYRTDVPERLPVALYKDQRLSGWKDNYVYKLPSGEIVAVYEDITDRVIAEERQRLVNAILEALNSPNEIVNLSHRILLLMKDHTGIEAVGIRLREGDDYPYMETNGLPAHFVEAERYLCARDARNEILQSSEGKPILEGMCGAVIAGKTDPSLPCFTKGGSFWTNSTSQLIASAGDMNGLPSMRSRCNEQGYESVALIPLRVGEGIVGLLQFNDRRPDRFTLDMIEYLEGIAASIGIVILRKEAAERLGASEAKYRIVADNTYDWEFWSDLNHHFIYISPSCERITGHAPEEFKADPDLMTRIIHHDDLSHYIEHRDWAVTKQTSGGIRFRIIRPDGEERWIEHMCQPILDADGTFLGHRGSNRDITDRERAEEALRESEERYRDILRTAMDGFWLTDKDGRLLQVNDSFCRMSGYSESELLGLGISDFDASHTPHEVRVRSRKIRASGQDRFGSRYRRKDGSLFDVDVSVQYRPNDGGRYACFVRDISAHKRFDAEAAARAAISTLFLQAAPLEVTCQKLAESLVNTLDFPMAAIELYDSVRDEMVFVGAAGMPGISTGLCVPVDQTLSGIVAVSGDDLCESRASQRAGYRLEQLRQFEIETFLCVPLRIGRKVIGTLAVADRSPRKDPSSWMPNLKTIASLLSLEIERKQAEDALRASEAKFRSYIESSPLAVLVANMEGLLLDFNAASLRLLGYDRATLSTMHIFDIHPPEDRKIVLRALAVLRQKGLVEGDYRLKKRDRQLIWVSLHAVMIGDQLGLAYCEDITERKRTEKALRDSVDEKVALLKEVHHRVKNNLQIVSGLLSLQANRTPNQEAIDILAETRNRVRSMALLHEMLYRSENLARIDFPAYVKELCAHLLHLSGAVSARVKVESHVASLGLALEQAVPCGLIINELVSNALKHGFPEERGGTVVIEVEPNEGRGLVLSVRDDGVGLPPGFDPEGTSTLGLKLVSNLAGQLGGQLTIGQSGEGGTVFAIIFPFPQDSVL